MNGRFLWPGPPTEKEFSWIEKNVNSLNTQNAVLDPLCSSGNLIYYCGVRGIRCTGIESRPFFHWLSSVKSYRYAETDGKMAGYAWERVFDNAFWEGETYSVSEGVEYPKKVFSFLGRVRYQIDVERYEGLKNLLKLGFLEQLQRMPKTDDSFDDRFGLSIFNESISKIISSVDQSPTVNQSINLCDYGNLPYSLHHPFDFVLSVLKPVCETKTHPKYAEMSRWMGFEYNGPKNESLRNTVSESIGQIDNTEETLSWCIDIFSVLKSLSKMMNTKTEGRFLIAEESGIKKNELLEQLGNLAGFECECSSDTFFFRIK